MLYLRRLGACAWGMLLRSYDRFSIFRSEVPEYSVLSDIYLNLMITLRTMYRYTGIIDLYRYHTVDLD